MVYAFADCLRLELIQQKKMGIHFFLCCYRFRERQKKVLFFQGLKFKDFTVILYFQCVKCLFRRIFL